MNDADRGEPASGQAVHALPVQPTTLAPPPKRAVPALCDSRSESIERFDVARHAVIGKVPAQHRGQPPTLCWDRVVTAMA